MVVGIDEVGRGSWAGPVTVAAVVPGDEHLSGVRDSKLLSPAERVGEERHWRYRLRRRSDGSILPVLFEEDDVREERRRGTWWV